MRRGIHTRGDNSKNSGSNRAPKTILLHDPNPLPYSAHLLTIDDVHKNKESNSHEGGSPRPYTLTALFRSHGFPVRCIQSGP